MIPFSGESGRHQAQRSVHWIASPSDSIFDERVKVRVRVGMTDPN